MAAWWGRACNDSDSGHHTREDHEGGHKGDTTYGGGGCDAVG